MISNKRILLVGNTAWSMFNFRLGVARALRETGYDVIIIAPYDHTSKDLLSEGFEHINIAIDNKGLSPKKDVRLLKELTSLYKRLRPDLIIHYTIKPNIYGGIAARLLDIKTISFVTGLGSVFITKTFVTRLVEMMYKLSFSFSQKVWFLNEEDYDFFIKRKIISEGKAEILPGEGINTSAFIVPNNINLEVAKNKDLFKFLYLGRILKDKGIQELIGAIRLLKPKYPNIQCQLLGFIDALNPSSISKSILDGWVEEGLVIYLGQTSDVKPYILDADCIVMPSYREGISRTLLEASCLQKPIVTTNVAGCRDIVDDNITGYLCEAMDPVDLSLKMESMLKLSQSDRNEMGVKARKKVLSQFDEVVIVKKYLSTLEVLFQR